MPAAPGAGLGLVSAATGGAECLGCGMSTARCQGSALVSLGEQQTTRGTGKHEPKVSANLALVRAQTVSCGISREMKCAASTPKTVPGGPALVTVATAFRG